jgi:hypothetical protein
MKVKVQSVSGAARWLLDSRPLVTNDGVYCGLVGFDNRAKYCETRPEGNAQREACDALVVGKAKDTGRVGPTWSDPDGKPCVGAGDTTTQPACVNNPDNQFLAVARGSGQYLACASEDWPLGDGGSRCGGCTLKPGDDVCR